MNDMAHAPVTARPTGRQAAQHRHGGWVPPHGLMAPRRVQAGRRTPSDPAD